MQRAGFNEIKTWSSYTIHAYIKFWRFARNTLRETKIQKFTPLSETTSIPICFIWESPPASRVNICCKVSIPAFQSQSLKIVCTVGSCWNAFHIIVCDIKIHINEKTWKAKSNLELEMTKHMKNCIFSAKTNSTSKFVTKETALLLPQTPWQSMRWLKSPMSDIIPFK